MEIFSFDSNIRFINDNIEEDGTLFNHASFCKIYPHVKTNFLEHAGIIHALKTFIIPPVNEVQGGLKEKLVRLSVCLSVGLCRFVSGP